MLKVQVAFVSPIAFGLKGSYGKKTERELVTMSNLLLLLS